MDLESKANLKVLPVFVTLDPQRDNPSHLRAYLKGQSYTCYCTCFIQSISCVVITGCG
jgi:hypothetical protein